jgi:CubicO group peptidase (beta-lactamase class C family)
MERLRTPSITRSFCDIPPVPGFPQLTEVLRDELNRDAVGVQLFASVAGESIINYAAGEALAGEEAPLDVDALSPWTCATKPVIACLVGALVDDGRISLDARVADFLSDYRDAPGAAVTVRAILTHTAGFVSIPRRGFGSGRYGTIDEVVDEVLWSPPRRECVRGGLAQYTVFSGWYVLGAIIQAVTRVPLDAYVRRAVFEPLGMADSWLAIPPEHWERLRARISPPTMQNRGRLTPVRRITKESVAMVCNPATGGLGPMRELAAFFRELLETWREERDLLLPPDLLRAMVRPQRPRVMDLWLKRECSYGLGFMTGLEDHGFGTCWSQDAFGHAGWPGVWAVCEPARDLVVCLRYNGDPRSHAAATDGRLPPENPTLRALVDDLVIEGV